MSKSLARTRRAAGAPRARQARAAPAYPSSQRIAVTVARASDGPGLTALIARAPLMRRYAVTASLAGRLIAEAFRTHDILLMAMHRRRAPVGLIWVIPTRAIMRTAYLRLLLVDKRWQSQGIGGALLTAAEARAAREGGRSMMLLVTHDNVRARTFYERAGYRHVGDLPGLVRPELTESMYFKRSMS